MASMNNVVSLAHYRQRPAARPRRLPRPHPRRFGRRQPFAVVFAEPAPSTAIRDDVRLFAATFAAGFLFVSVLIV